MLYKIQKISPLLSKLWNRIAFDLETRPALWLAL